jgi:hypothetical protein
MKSSPKNLPNDVDLLKKSWPEIQLAKDNNIELKDAEIAELKHSVSGCWSNFVSPCNQYQ